eukprot:scaffold318542_cov20-Prasinocladus_malaysianus.AAC.1
MEGMFGPSSGSICSKAGQDMTVAESNDKSQLLIMSQRQNMEHRYAQKTESHGQTLLTFSAT